MASRKILSLAAGCLLCCAGTLAVQAADNLPVSQLDTVVVTADRNESAKKEVTTNITVIDRQTIESSSANDLGELLAQAGFQTRQYPGTLNSVGIRGYRSDTHGNDLSSRVLILLNGRRIASGNTAILALNNIERIDIMHGPGAVQYGAAAMGGVVNVITRKGVNEATDSFTAMLEGGAGSFNSYKLKAAAAANANNFDATFGYSYYENDDYKDSKGDRYKHTREKGTSAYNLDAGYTFMDLHRVGLNIYYFQAENTYSPQGKSWQTAGSTFGDSDKSNINGDINYSGGTANGMFAWSLNYGLGQDEQIRYERDFITGSKTGGRSRYTTDAQTGQAQITFNYDFLTVTTGFDYLNYDLDNRKIKSEYKNYAGFVLGKLRLFDEKVILSAGGRYDDFKVKGKSQNADKNESHFSPAAGIAYLPFSWLKLRANYAQGFIMPQAEHIFGGQYYAPAKNLKPEKNDTYEAGFDIGWNYLDFSFTYFYSKGKDVLIAQMVDPMNYISRYYNVAKAKREGLEVAFSGDVAKAMGYTDFELRPYVNLTYMMTYEGRDSSGQPWTKLPYVTDVNIGYGVRFSYPEYAFTTTLNFAYFGNEKIQNYKNGAPWPYETINHGKFTVVDWTARKQLFDTDGYGKIDIKVEINNLFDQKYAYVADYPMAGRNFYVGLVYNY